MPLKILFSRKGTKKKHIFSQYIKEAMCVSLTHGTEKKELNENG